MSVNPSSNSFRTTTRFFPLCWASLQDQYQEFMARLMQSKCCFQRWWLVSFHSNTVFLKIYNSLSYSLCTYNIWKRSVEKYKSYGTLSKTTHFLSMVCEAGVVQQCTDTQAGIVQDGLKPLFLKTCHWIFMGTNPSWNTPTLVKATFCWHSGWW